MSILETHNISVRYKTKGKGYIQALSDFSVKLNEGDIFALLGKNGAGKSTAMYACLGLLKPNRGSVFVFGESPTPGSPLYEKVAYLPEEPHYHQFLTVREMLEYYSAFYKEKRVTRAEINDVLERLGMESFQNLPVKKCSKGMKQKAGIAACMLSNAKLVFLDEPTRGLDPLIVKEFRDILIEMNRRGATIILNSHILSEVELVCNRVAVIDKGKLITEDKITNLVKVEKGRYVVEYTAKEPIPEYINVTLKTPDTIKGEIPAAELIPFVQFVESEGLILYRLEHKKKTLEEVFHNLLQEGEKNDA